MNNKNLTEEEWVKYKKIFEEEMQRYLKLIEKDKDDWHKQIESFLEYKEQKEKLIEELLKDKLGNLEVIKIHIGFLTEITSLIRYYKLEAEGKMEEAIKLLYADYMIIKNDLYEKYNIDE